MLVFSGDEVEQVDPGDASLSLHVMVSGQSLKVSVCLKIFCILDELS